MQHIGLLGGTFDPIHLGHLHLAKTVCQMLTLDEVRLMPCYQAVHREQPIASPEQRLAMVRLACEDSPKIHADDTEIKRSGPSYMIDSLKTFKHSYPDAQLYLIIGYDALMNFTTWKDWQGILKLCHLIVAKRPGHNNQNESSSMLIKQYGAEFKTLKSQTHGKVCVLEVNALDISSTAIRKNINDNKDVSSALPTKVYHFIKQEGLYAKN